MCFYLNTVPHKAGEFPVVQFHGTNVFRVMNVVRIDVVLIFVSSLMYVTIHLLNT